MPRSRPHPGIAAPRPGPVYTPVLPVHNRLSAINSLAWVRQPGTLLAASRAEGLFRRVYFAGCRVLEAYPRRGYSLCSRDCSDI